MELLQLQPLLAAVAVVKEAARIFRRNGRLTIPIASFGVLVYSTLFLTNLLSLRPYLSELMKKLSFLLVSSPMSAEYANLLIGLQEDVSIFFGVEWIFAVCYLVVNLLFSTATVSASAISHSGKDSAVRIDVRDLAKLTLTSWKRPLLTSLFTLMFGIGYVVLVLAILLPIALPMVTFATIIVTLVAGLLYAYIGVIWATGMVISVVENRSGIEALGEAARIIKGMRIQGYALSLIVTVTLTVISQLWRLASIKRPWWNELIGFTVVNLMWLVRMFSLMCYTVYYYDCKSFHGEEVATDELIIPGDDRVNYAPV